MKILNTTSMQVTSCALPFMSYVALYLEEVDKTKKRPNFVWWLLLLHQMLVTFWSWAQPEGSCNGMGTFFANIIERCYLAFCPILTQWRGQIDFRVQTSIMCQYLVHLPHELLYTWPRFQNINRPDFSFSSFLLLAHVDHVLKGLVEVIADPGKKLKSQKMIDCDDQIVTVFGDDDGW